MLPYAPLSSLTAIYFILMPTCDPTHHPILQERKYWDYDIVAARRRDIARRLAEEGEAGRGRATDDEEEEGEDIYEADRGEAAVEEEEGEFEEDGEMEGGELLARRRKFRRHDIDPHVLQPLRRCLFGCGAMVFPEEGGICCASGSHILGPDFNPPIDARYLSLLQQPFMGSDSRVRHPTSSHSILRDALRGCLTQLHRPRHPNLFALWVRFHHLACQPAVSWPRPHQVVHWTLPLLRLGVVS